MSVCALNPQLPLIDEPLRLYRPETGSRARFALCTKKGNGLVDQQLFDVSQLPWVMDQLAKASDLEKINVWVSQATLREGARNRRISSIVALNAVWCDIDLLHPPAGFSGAVPPGDLSKFTEVDRLAQLLLMQLQDAGIPAPTYIVATGGGLCPKWVFDKPLPAAARARWQSLQTTICSKIASITGSLGELKWSWPVDHKASDAARILRLVGTHNPRWGAPCRIAAETGLMHDFEALADAVLQYTRADVAAFREKMKQAAGWSKNRAKAAAAGIFCEATSPIRGLLVFSAISDGTQS